MHARIPLPSDAGTIDAIRLLAAQLEEDRRHMQQLKSAIEFTHERVETQSAALEAHGHQFAEQTAVNMKLFKGLAEAKGDLTQHKVRCETFHADIQTAVSGPGLLDMMTVCIEEKIGAIHADMNKVKVIVEDHERREREMGAYLSNLAGDRPTEGRFIVGKFEQHDAKLSELMETVSNVQTAGIMNATAEQADIDEVKSKVAMLAGAYEALRTNGNVASFSDLQGRLTAVERAQSAASSCTAAASPSQVGGGGTVGAYTSISLTPASSSLSERTSPRVSRHLR